MIDGNWMTHLYVLYYCHGNTCSSLKLTKMCYIIIWVIVITTFPVRSHMWIGINGHSTPCCHLFMNKWQHGIVITITQTCWNITSYLETFLQDFLEILKYLLRNLQKMLMKCLFITKKNYCKGLNSTTLYFTTPSERSNWFIILRAVIGTHMKFIYKSPKLITLRCLLCSRIYAI